MPWSRVLLCLPFLCAGGCSWVPHLNRNLVGTTAQVIGDYRAAHVMRRLAKRAWAEVARAAEKPYSCAYADGFRDGFIDSVDRNIRPDPPTIPPLCYRYPVVRTPEQQQAIEDWYAGFRHGAQVAHEERWRDGVILPISRPPLIGPTGFGDEIIPPSPAAQQGSVNPLPQLPAPQLPAPRLLEVPPGPARLGAPIPRVDCGPARLAASD